MVRTSGLLVLRTVLVWLQECIAIFCPLQCNVFLKLHSQNAFSAFVCSIVSFVSFLSLGYMPLDLEDELWLLL